MTTPTITLASGRVIELPMFDPFVAAHFSNASSYTETLLHQINVERIYAPLFEEKRDLTFLDIGANAGLVSIYASDSCRRIVAVEPAPETYRVLQSLTGGFPKIETVRAALAPVDGPVEFYTNDLNSTASSTVNTYGTKTTVPGMKLSSILRVHQLEKVDVCKVDAEGSEGESLTFAELENAAPIVETWFCETHNCPKTTWMHKLGTLVAYLSQLGYHKQQISGMTLIATR